METLRSFFTPEVLWILGGIILLILEFAMPGLVLFFFGIGAILVGVVCLIADPSFTVQLLIFLSSSLILLFSLRRWLKKVFFGKKTDGSDDFDDSTDSFINEKAMVLEKITPDMPGKVELHGTAWKAESDETIHKGKPVIITGKTNLVLKVKSIS